MRSFFIKNKVHCVLKTSMIGDRFRMHTQNCSSLKKHLIDAHSIDRVTTVELVKDVKILALAANKSDRIFLEAILLKEHKPTINSQMEGEERI